MVEFGLLAPKVSFGFGDLHTFSSPQPGEVGFELRHLGQDIEEQSADWIVWVINGAAQFETHLSNRKFVDNRPSIREGAGQPIEFGNNKSVALTASGQGLT